MYLGKKKTDPRKDWELYAKEKKVNMMLYPNKH